MVSTADWTDDLSTKIQTNIYSSKAMTTSAEMTPPASMSLFPYMAALLFFGILGTLTNGFVLGGFWLSDWSKLTSSSVHIVNHTTLELLTISRPFLQLYNHLHM